MPETMYNENQTRIETVRSRLASRIQAEEANGLGFNQEIGRIKLENLSKNEEKIEILTDFFDMIDRIKTRLDNQVVDENVVKQFLNEVVSFICAIRGEGVEERCRDVVDMLRSQLVPLQNLLELLLRVGKDPIKIEKYKVKILNNINKWKL